MINGAGPPRGSDDGSADPAVTAALAAYAAGRRPEADALAALSAARLLVPVVPVTATAAGPASPDPARAGDPGSLRPARRGERATDVAFATLIGRDGRPALPAFTGLDPLRRWQESARPLPVAARQVWQDAVARSCAVVIDVAGPVPLAVEGARLAALARGEAPPPLWSDPDVREVVARAVAGRPEIGSFELWPEPGGGDLVIAVSPVPGSDGRRLDGAAAGIGNAVMTGLGGRIRRGVAVVVAPGA